MPWAGAHPPPSRFASVVPWIFRGSVHNWLRRGGVVPNMRLKLSGPALKGIGRCRAWRAAAQRVGPLRPLARRPQLNAIR